MKLARFYRRAYRAITQVARPGTRIVYSDGYAPLRLTNCFWLMIKPDFPVILDTHVYQLFGAKDKNRTYEQHLRRLRWVAFLLKFLRLQQPVMVGEWSAMLPIKTNHEQTTAYVQTQQMAFSSSVAQCYWTYKTEADGRWNYRDLAKKELVQ
jgi:glucan 1,3-beta-glucosidase